MSKDLPKQLEDIIISSAYPTTLGCFPETVATAIMIMIIIFCSVCRTGVHTGYIVMTPMLSQSTVFVLLEYSPGKVFSSFNYTYMENPHIVPTSALRKSGFVR